MTRRRPQPYGTAEATSAFGLGLHHVQLAIPPGSEDLWVRSGRLEIHLGVEKDFRPARKAHPGILVDDLEGLARRLTEKGVEVTWDEHFPGHRRFYAFDALGNRLEFLSPGR
jgi:hypothetical protein